MGLCFCVPQKAQSSNSWVIPHTLSYKFRNGDLDDSKNLINDTAIFPNYKSPDIPLSNEGIKETEDFNKEAFQRSQTEILIRNEEDELNMEEERNKKNIKIEDFLLLKVIGRGSFGKVMLVEKKDTKKLYAMKILKKETIEKRNQKIHTKAERDILQNMNCPFIVQLNYAFQTSEKLYLVMEFMRGGELFYHLRKSKKFDEDKAKFYIAEIILALEYLHKKDIIYRDLKPENVLLNNDGHVKLVDFGLSKVGVSYGEKAYTFCGTPEYLAPEILLGKGHDKSADWWSLVNALYIYENFLTSLRKGALLYEMMSGAPPFYSKDKTQMFKNILEKKIPMKNYFSAEASSILQALLCLDPEKRLGSSLEDAAEIKRHPFFLDIDWASVQEKAYQPPFRPKLNGKLDVANFDNMFTDEIPKDTPGNQQTKNEIYSNFSYFPKELTISYDSIYTPALENSGEFIENPNFNLNKNRKK